MLYRSIPKVDVLLEDPEIQGLIETYSRDTVVESIHLEMDALRKYIGTCEEEEKAKEQIFYISDDCYFPTNYTALDMAAFYQLHYPKFEKQRFAKI